MAQTTLMRDSIIGDEWIREMVRRNPVRRVLDLKTGQPTANILGGPVRLAFVDNLLIPGLAVKPKPGEVPDPNAKMIFQVTILFPPITDLTLIWQDLVGIGERVFGNRKGSDGRWYGMKWPLLPCDDKSIKLQGYTPGAFYANVKTKYKPPVVDIQNNPIVDPSRIKPGMWAIPSINAYESGKGTQDWNPRLGLQSIMIVADDQNLGGGGANPAEQFAGVNIAPPAMSPDAAFGQPAAGPPAGAPPTGAYYGPGQSYAPAAAPPPAPSYANPYGAPPAAADPWAWMKG